MDKDINIEKPISLLKEDYMRGVVNLTNESRLPLFIVEYVLKDILNEVHAVSTKQLQEDREKYSAAINAIKSSEGESEKSKENSN